MTDTQFSLCGTSLSARPSGALWWADAEILCIADLHLGRSERQARRGGTLMPPYETKATLDRIECEIAALDPRCVICLGDSFDDNRVLEAFDDSARWQLSAMMSGRRWIWVAGNHDPMAPGIGGTSMEEVSRGPLTFRHIAMPRAEAGEVSAHYHPKTRVRTRAGMVSRPCFIHDARRLILPAFGTYTGGLNCTSESLQTLFEDDALCILTGRATTSVPLRRRESA